MAKSKGRGTRPATGTDVGPDEEEEKGVTIIPLNVKTACADCATMFPVCDVVDPWQVVGNGTFRCIKCREKRMKEAYQQSVGLLKEKVNGAREAAKQQPLDLKA